MLVLLAAAVFSYQLEPADYELKVEFDGYLPILGGIEQQTLIEMTLGVTPLEPEDGALRASGALKAFRVSLRDRTTGEPQPLPITLEAARAAFPETRVSFTPFGRVLKNEAPQVRSPLRLPGFHVRHLAEMTYLFLQFPEDGAETDKPWRFQRKLGEDVADFEAVYEGPGDKGHRFTAKFTQEFESFEDSNRNPVEDRDSAAYRVMTRVAGSGEVWFSEVKGIIVSAVVTANADSIVLPIGVGAESKRALRTKVQINKVTIR